MFNLKSRKVALTFFLTPSLDLSQSDKDKHRSRPAPALTSALRKAPDFHAFETSQEVGAKGWHLPFEREILVTQNPLKRYSGSVYATIRCVRLLRAWSDSHL